MVNAADEDAAAKGPPTTRSTSRARLETRPILSAEELKARAKELRALYKKLPAEWPKPTLDPGVEHLEIGKLPPPEYPKDNPFSKAKVELGQMLFFDPRLSGSGQIACASCHDPDLAWADGRTVSFGHDRAPVKRNAPSVLFSAYVERIFWDGRADSLEDQFHSPIAAHEEMNAEPEKVVNRLGDIPEYAKKFKEVFGSEGVTLEKAAKAVATFERSLGTWVGRSDFDRFLEGRKPGLSDPAIRGLHLFRTNARCMNCHNGPAFTDNQFHDEGLSYYGRKNQDLGRYEVTKDAKDVGGFKTPSLRDVGRTRPYMHNGVFDLAGVINMYNAGMPAIRPREEEKSDPLFPKKDPLLKPLGLNEQDREDLKAFLESLSELPMRMRPPVLPGQTPAVDAKPAGPAKVTVKERNGK
jgi:cytochrome c peroxidase